MIEEIDLIKFRKLTEEFADITNGDNGNTDISIESNNTIKRICQSMIDQPTASLEQEAELCYVLLLAMSSLVIVGTSPLIDKSVDRSLRILDKLSPSLPKARLLTYLYCLESDEEYLEEAQTIISTWQGREMTPEEKRLQRDIDFITM